MTRLRDWARCARGGSAVEFALVLPAFITLMVGIVSAGQLFFAVNSLHYAVQDAARCAAVKTTVCTDSASTVTYAQGRYAGPSISPNFTYSTSGCGHAVSATATYAFDLAVTSISVPIAASACYP